MAFKSTIFQATRVLLLAVVSCVVTFADAPSHDAAREYARAISAAQSDLDHGRIMEARHKLESTDKSQRSLEYAYLAARARSAPAKGPAPDLIETIEAPKVEFRYAVMSEVGSQVAFVCRDGTLRVYDLRTPAKSPKVVSHEGSGALWSGVFSADGRFFVAGGETGQVLVWETATWNFRAAVPVGKELPVRELAVAPDGSALAAEGDTAIELWSLTNTQPKKMAKIGKRYNFGEGLAFSPTGNFIATGGMFDIDLFNARTGEKAQTLRHASYTMGLAFSPDGSRIAAPQAATSIGSLPCFKLTAARCCLMPVHSRATSTGVSSRLTGSGLFRPHATK